MDLDPSSPGRTLLMPLARPPCIAVVDPPLLELLPAMTPAARTFPPAPGLQQTQPTIAPPASPITDQHTPPTLPTVAAPIPHSAATAAPLPPPPQPTVPPQPPNITCLLMSRLRFQIGLWPRSNPTLTNALLFWQTSELIFRYACLMLRTTCPQLLAWNQSVTT